jgi:dihydropteroate synthase type 2
VPPTIFGILNVTADSFSDGGRYLDPAAALARAEALIAAGADVLDIGAASSNPDAACVPSDVEIARLAPLVARAREKGWAVSIDSFAPETQNWALDHEVAYLNDIQGFPDAGIYPRLARANAKLVVMHAVGAAGRAGRPDTDPATIMGRIHDFFDRRIVALTAAGIARERLILDPGMGFFLGSDPAVSLSVLKRLPELKAAFGLPLLVSVSRKSFLRKLTGRAVADIAPATLAAELFVANHGADIIRTHEPSFLCDALTIWRHLS